MSWSVQDSARLEASGIPTVVVLTEPFVESACDLAVSSGIPFLPLVSVPHPMARLSAAEVRVRAREALPAIEEKLVREPVENRPSAAAAADMRYQSIPPEVSSVHEVLEANGWTDGFPVVPPEVGLVGEFVAQSGLAGDTSMPPVPPLMRSAALERWAANAAMAGARPQYFPAILAAMEALLDPAAGLYSSQTATNPSSPILIFNGPVAARIGINAGANCLGSGSRTNAVMGRSIRLILHNIGGERPGLNAPSTHGQAGEFTYCFAENEEESPWEPFSVSRGYKPAESTVTVVMGNPPQSLFGYGLTTADDLLRMIVDNLTTYGHMNVLFETGPLLVLSPEHARLLADGGYSRRDIQELIYNQARFSLDTLPVSARVAASTRRARWFQIHGAIGELGVADRPDDVHVVVAGGPGIHSLFVSTSFSAHPVTRPIALDSGGL